MDRKMRFICLLLSLFIFILHIPWGDCSEAEDRLMMDIFRGYNYLIQPVRNLSELPIVVKVALQLVLLINVDEKEQVMHTNVWVTLRWYDFQMRWNPVEYGEIRNIRVSPDKVWLPDIVLFNNADGTFEVSFECNVVIEHDGSMLWVPPAIYKSSCIIDVEYFPFDEQTCYMIFGSWTYNEKEIILEFSTAEYVDLSEYSISSIWDVIDAPASLVNKRSRIEFQVKIRRKTLFYTVVLIIPTILMAFLSIAVFFLPTDSTEKMTLAISVLLSIVVFLLLVTKILPPTSSTIPLMAKYLLLTFVLNVITILTTVIVVNIYFRRPDTNEMSPWIRKLFLDILPIFMCMKRPKRVKKRKKAEKRASGIITDLPGLGKFSMNTAVHHPHCQSANGMHKNHLCPPPESAQIQRDPQTSAFYPLTADALRAIDAIEYITDHLRKKEEFKMLRDDWKYVAMIIDRLLLYIFFGITLGGTCGILLAAPNVFEVVNQEEILDKMRNIYYSPKE